MSPSRNNGNGLGMTDLFMLLVTIIWGINLSLIKISLRELRPHAFNGIRLGLTALLFGLILLAGHGGGPIARKDFWKVIGLSLLGVTVYQWLFIRGIERTGASTTSIILAMGPVFIAVLSTLLGYERIHWAAWAGIAVSFIGLYAVIAGPTWDFRFSTSNLRGDLILLIANLCWASYTVLSKKILDRIAPARLAAVTTIIGTIFYIPLAAKDMAVQPYDGISWGAWGALAFSAAFALVFGYIAWYASVKKVGNARTGIYSSLNPVFAVLFAAAVLSERITSLQAAGAAVILAGVWLTRSGYRLFAKN